MKLAVRCTMKGHWGRDGARKHRLTPGETFLAVRDFANSDPYALMVCLPDGVEHIGWVPKRIAALLAGIGAHAAQCTLTCTATDSASGIELVAAGLTDAGCALAALQGTDEFARAEFTAVVVP